MRRQLEGVAQRGIEHQFAAAGRSPVCGWLPPAAGSSCAMVGIGLVQLLLQQPAARRRTRWQTSPPGRSAATLPDCTSPCLSSAWPSKVSPPCGTLRAFQRRGQQHRTARLSLFRGATDPRTPPPCPLRPAWPRNAAPRRSSGGERKARAYSVSSESHVFDLVGLPFGLGLERVQFDQLVFLEALRLGQFGPAVEQRLFEFGHFARQRQAFGFDLRCGRRSARRWPA